MDFTEMPEFLGYNHILVVVDWFSKEVVFAPCTKEETTYSTTELFRDHVWCQHGLTSTVVSDCGSVFTSNFLRELYKLLGIKRKMSTAFHPQTDGQTKQLNCEINQYLRTYINDCQGDWAKWIKIVQFIWNNTVSEVTTDSPFGITQSYSPCMSVEPAETVRESHGYGYPPWVVGMGTGGCGCGYRFWIPTPIPIPTWWVFRG